MSTLLIVNQTKRPETISHFFTKIKSAKTVSSKLKQAEGVLLDVVKQDWDFDDKDFSTMN